MNKLLQEKKQFIVVKQKNFEHNVAQIRKVTNKKIIAVVKANAYGHGLIPSAKAASNTGADYLGVALLEEAFLIRESGIKTPILAWLTPPGLDYERAVAEKIEIGV